MDPHAAGFRMVPHTADLMIEAWGSTRDSAFENAARGLVASFGRPERPATTTIDLALPSSPTDALMALLEEIVFLADARGLLPVDVVVADDRATLELAPLSRSTTSGAAPKAITYHALSVEQRADTWRCRFVVDV